MNSFWDQNPNLGKQLSLNNIEMQDPLKNSGQNYRRKSCIFCTYFSHLSKILKLQEKKQIELELAIKAKGFIYKSRQLEMIKNTDAEITSYVKEHHSQELMEEVLWEKGKKNAKWEKECKSTEVREKDEFEKKVEWFKTTKSLK